MEVAQERAASVARGALWALLAVAPSLALALALALALVVIYPEHLVPLTLLLGLYFATPVAKEAWVAIAPWKMGIPAPLAFATLLVFEACVCLLVVRALPVDALMRRIQRARTVQERVDGSRFAHRKWARVVVRPVDFVLRRVQRAGGLREKVATSPLGRRSLALALALALALPFHSGGAILGSATGRSLGLSRRGTFLAVVAAATWRLGIVMVIALALL